MLDTTIITVITPRGQLFPATVRFSICGNWRHLRSFWYRKESCWKIYIGLNFSGRRGSSHGGSILFDDEDEKLVHKCVSKIESLLLDSIAVMFQEICDKNTGSTPLHCMLVLYDYLLSDNVSHYLCLWPVFCQGFWACELFITFFGPIWSIKILRMCVTDIIFILFYACSQ